MEPVRANPRQPELPPRLLTAQQVAAILQWNHYTVIKKAERAELPGFKLGRAWRFRQEDIVAWIDAKRNAK